MYVPVDVIKERLQVQRRLRSGQEIPGSLPMYRGTWHALTTIMETEGLRGVYRVSGPRSRFLPWQPSHRPRD